MNNLNRVQSQKFCMEYLLHTYGEGMCELTDDVVFTSSTTGICMERLGLIQSDWAKSYVSGRGGSYRIEDKVYCFRDVLDWLDGLIDDLEPLITF